MLNLKTGVHNMKDKSLVVSLILIAILLFFVIFFLVPFTYGVFISFTNWDGIAKHYDIIGFGNYVRMFNDKRFHTSVFTTLKYATVLLCFTLLFGYINAKVIHHLHWLQSRTLFILFLPYTITPVISCILWNQLYIGLFPQIGKKLGVIFLQSNLLANKNTALYAVSFVDLWMLIPYAMLLFNSALNAIPQELIESAKLEGASTFQIAVYIEFPYILSTAGMLTTIVLSNALMKIDTIMTLTSGGPARATETLYYTIYRNSTEELHYAYGLAEGMIVSLFCVLVFLIVNKIMVGKYTSDINL